MVELAIVFATAFFVLILGPMLYLTYLGYQREQHSPPSAHSTDDATANGKTAGDESE